MNFIGKLLKPSSGKTMKMKESVFTRKGSDAYVTLSKRYSIDDFRLIIETPGEILSKYHLSFINDQVSVTLKLSPNDRHNHR